MVWRISEAAPLGEWVHPEDPDANHARIEPAADGVARETSERGWHHSSHDLAQGTEVHEGPLDTLPDDVFDQLFKK